MILTSIKSYITPMHNGAPIFANRSILFRIAFLSASWSSFSDINFIQSFSIAIWLAFVANVAITVDKKNIVTVIIIYILWKLETLEILLISINANKTNASVKAINYMIFLTVRDERDNFNLSVESTHFPALLVKIAIAA